MIQETPAPEAMKSGWLLLIHQLPPEPAYLRVKIWRRLQALGAITLKNTVYVLPNGEESLEDLEWLRREILDGDGEAWICEARFVSEGVNEQVRDLFSRARDADYAELAGQAKAAMAELANGDVSGDGQLEALGHFKRLSRRLAQIIPIDFFGAPGQTAAKHEIEALKAHAHEAMADTAGVRRSSDLGRLRRSVWITRQGVKVDRIASAWLIRRFIDPEARFKFVAEDSYTLGPDELRFDMFEAEFTHEGDRCTFEVLLDRTGLGDNPGLRAIGEIVHDIDLKDGKFGRAEAVGIDQLVGGIALTCADDEARLARGARTFDDLYAYFDGPQD